MAVTLVWITGAALLREMPHVTEAGGSVDATDVATGCVGIASTALTFAFAAVRAGRAALQVPSPPPTRARADAAAAAFRATGGRCRASAPFPSSSPSAASWRR